MVSVSANRYHYRQKNVTFCRGCGGIAEMKEGRSSILVNPRMIEQL